MASLPKPATLVTWALYFIPVYLFILDPLLRSVFPANPESEINIFDVPASDPSTPLPSHLTDDSFISPEDGVPYTCPDTPANYKVHLLSRTPLILYLENFISDSEADHLVDISLNKYTPSIVWDGVSERVDPDRRLSDRALLDRDDTVRCLEDRARAFQGWRPHLYIERMWAQRYNTSGHYRHHYDWTGSLSRGGDRLSTFMDAAGEAVVSVPGVRGGRRRGGGAKKEGITFKPIKGNAIFWENLRPDGTGYPETWHAAFPVTKGTKVGLNIWSWYQPPGIGRG
ncbi:hypothetical protein N7468_004551 [Penicillium chermesinum]|uniref:Prolyl 4-hydroxylase alpha subunit domain-containing protein n=1 Tax=Penicillium chermesinum TaxID=63820 RepID=A0A9W9TSV5_9EURO|nr:uncharacterized protein N7468_004551 [Penicillium chermesinum]KAJ5239932.1 hypothetical protein N7468_004551 [Penicillium chermesinum]